jgi:hypothetical protein
MIFCSILSVDHLWRVQQQSAIILGLHLSSYPSSVLEISVKALPMLVTDDTKVFRGEVQV